MIFNPYDIPSLTDTAAGQLHWTVPLLRDNMLVVGLVLVFLAADLLACCPRGVLRYQLNWLISKHNERTFEPTIIRHPWLKPVLLVQLFLCAGMTLFCFVDPSPSQHLLHPDAATLGHIALCCAILLSWYLLQWGLFSWFCYLFGMTYHSQILNRTYQAGFVLVAPLTMLCLMAIITGLISTITAVNLLAVLFILSQISFILNGIKIFYQGFGSLFVIIVYLCALEIAPLLMLWAKFGPK